MNIVKTYLDKDNYGGIGLFAAEYIPKVTLIWKFHEHFDKRMKSEDFDFILREGTPMPKPMQDYLKRYTSVKNGEVILYFDDARFCNHSNTPNTHGYPEQYASYGIEKGEEITCDYSVCNDSFSEEEFNELKSYK